MRNVGNKMAAPDNELIKIIKQYPLKDILVGGYYSKSKKKIQNHLLFQTVYLCFERHIFRLHSDYDSDEIEISDIKKIQCDFELGKGESFTITSMNEVYLNNSLSENIITGFEVYSIDYPRVTQGPFKALGFQFEYDDYLFFDPICYTGMQVGKHEVKKNWEEYNKNKNYQKYEWLRKTGLDSFVQQK